MRILNILFLLAFGGSSLCADVASIYSQPSSQKLLGDFQDGWTHHWMERKFTRQPTRYTVVREDGNSVLMAESEKSASGLWRMLDIHSVKTGKISWRWKVTHSLSENVQERKKRGDDYAARVFVVFEPSFFSWRTRAICYVWAAHEPVGSIYKSPYSSSVGTIVLESGNERAGKWITEERDFIADYRKIFGNAPEMVSAVALMVDTDNTGLKTTAWFDDLVLEL